MSALAPSPAFPCLVVEDDAGFASLLADTVREQGGEPAVCPDLREARRRIAERPFAVACLDNRLPDGTGYEFHAELSRRWPDCIAVMITGVPELAQAVELTRNGLFDYLTKPIDADQFVACLRRVKQRLARPTTRDAEDAMIGSAPALAEALDLLRRAARHAEATILLLGETGTGKDLAARLLHRWTFAGRASPPPYVALNCAALPPEIFEAELFGSERGAYTGADRRRAGLVEAAAGGTLFLDEVTEIPLPLQAKLLRFLESREYRPVGSTATHHFTGRVVAATNRTLLEEVQRGRLREDLMYRLDVTAIRIPPLRERLADIPALAESLLAQLCTKYDRRRLRLNAADLQTLAGYRFPGNVRELRNLLERSLLRAPEEAAWLRLDLEWLRPSPPAATQAPEPPAAATANAAFGPGPASALSPLEAQEFQLIQQTLREEGGAIRRTAARLGLTHQALLRRLQKWPELRQGLGSPPP